MNPKPFKRRVLLLSLLCLGILMPVAAWAKPKDRKPAAVVSDYVEAARTALERNDPMAALTAVERYFPLASDTAAERAEMATTLKMGAFGRRPAQRRLFGLWHGSRNGPYVADFLPRR